jgi:hypothetical protein
LRARAGAERLGRPLARPEVEPLEDRLLLSTFWWIGSKANTNWSTPANWATDARPGLLPTISDTVIFSLTDPHNPKHVVNAASTLDAAFRGTAVGTLIMDASYTGVLTLAKGLTVGGSFTQAGGTMTGEGALVLSHQVVWSGGTMSGSGQTLVRGTQALGPGPSSQIGAKPVTLDKRQLVIDSSSTILFGGLNGTANVTLKNGASILNNGTSVLMSGQAGGVATITGPNGQGTFWNAGSIQVGMDPGRATQGSLGQGIIPGGLAPTVVFHLDVRFNDMSSVTVEPNAWLWVSGGGTGDGVLTTLGNTRSQVGNALFTGQGTTAYTWDRATFQGPGTVFLAGNASAAGRTVAQNFTFVSGQLSLGSMAVGGNFRWLSGTMTGTGIFVLNPGTTGQIGFTGVNPALTPLTPVVGSALAGLVSSATPALSQSAVFSNGGTVVLQSASGGSGLLLTGNANSHFDNNGTMTAQNSSGIGGGAGALVGTVVNTGAILPGGGGQPAVLSVSGTLNEQPAASITIDIEGNTPGTGYDQVNDAGFAKLDGTLNVTLNGYTPDPSDTFLVLALPGGYSGTFSSVNLPPAFANGTSSFQLVYAADGVRLTVVDAGPGSGLMAQGTSLTAMAGTPFYAVLAWVVGPITGGAANSYTAMIDWGNGTTTAGMIVPGYASTFLVVGGNTYAVAGTYAVSVIITDSSNNSTTVTTTFTVLATDTAPFNGVVGAL